jgi:phospholipid/cholesterol/gamma-HCH transport system ATP-binding protein
MEENKQNIENQQFENVIEIRNLNLSFGDNHVLRDFSLDVPRGEIIAVLGRSGSGKSVLIKCIIGLIKPDSGSIKVLGKDILTLSPSELDKLRMRMGFLFQSNALYDSMTVRENLLFPMRRHRIKKTEEEVDDLVQEALTNVELPHTQEMMPVELSGGMKKRIALARTLILKPEVILYDEPTTGLDPITSKGISTLIVDLQHKYNASSILITHDLDSIKIVANRVAMLIDGACYTIGTYDELEASDDINIKSFFIK